MTDVLERRGPDDSGVEAHGRVTLGNRRLAILDLTAAGHQPMWSADGRFVITFNGEIYNYQDVRDELGLAPSELRSGTDTEIILHAWQRWGQGSLDRLVGQWAFAIYDRQAERVWLCRDRFGEKPLFYHKSHSTLTFASSISSLFAAPWIGRDLDGDALVEYLTMRYVVAPRTIIAGVQKLPGGHLLRADRNGVHVERWYAPHFHTEAAGLRRRDVVDQFDEIFLRAAKRCLVSDVPVALLLSDGIDSNSILAALERQQEDIRAFTYTLADRSGGLSPARAAGNGATAMDLLVTPEERLEKMVPAFSSFTEPVGDGAALATWLLIRNARDHATVFLCGHGGDEVMGGYRLSQDRFRLAAVRELAKFPEPWVAPLIDRHVNGAEPIAERRRAIAGAMPRMAPAVARYLIHRPLPFGDLDTILGGQAPGGRYLSTVDRLYENCLDESADIDRMQEVMLHTFLSENILTFADSVAMDSSAELRMPFLDRDLVEFVLALPPSMRVGRWPGRTNTKLVLRWWSHGRIPDDVIRRRKRAFPFGNLPALLERSGDVIRDYVLGSPALTRSLPGLETWLQNPPEYFRGPWEGALWALVSLGIWTHAHRVNSVSR